MADNEAQKVEADVLDAIESVVSYAHREGHASLGFLHNGAFLSVLEVPLSFIESRAKDAPVTTATAPEPEPAPAPVATPAPAAPAAPAST